MILTVKCNYTILAFKRFYKLLKTLNETLIQIVFFCKYTKFTALYLNYELRMVIKEFFFH